MDIIPFLQQSAWFLLLMCFVSISSFFLTLWAEHFRVQSLTKAVLTFAVIVIGLIISSEIILGYGNMLFFKYLLWYHGLLALFVTSISIYPTIKRYAVNKEHHAFDQFTFFAVFTPFLCIILLRFFHALYQVPIEYDNIAYHLPFVVEWFKTGSLHDVYFSAFAGPVGYYPSNFELLDLWLLLPYGRDYMINLINAPFFALTFVGLYGVSRNLGIDQKSAMLAPALFLFTPVVVKHAGVPQVDLFFSLMFILSIFFIQEVRKTHRISDLLLLTTCLGLFIGTKYLGLVYSAPLLLALGVYWLIITWKKGNRLKGAALIPIMLVILTITGGFWYIRNAMHTGNPVFPAQVEIMGHTVFQGFKSLNDEITNYTLARNVKDLESVWTFIEGFFEMVGAQLFLLTLGIILTFGYFLYASVQQLVSKDFARKAYYLKSAFLSWILVFATLLYFVLYWISPYSFHNILSNVRYAMVFLVIGSLTVSFIVHRLKVLQPIFYFATFLALIVALLMQQQIPDLTVRLDLIRSYPYDFALFVLIFFGFFYSVISLEFLRRHRMFIVLPLCIAALTLIPLKSLYVRTLPLREDNRMVSMKEWYQGALHWINLLEASERIANEKQSEERSISFSGFSIHYPLFGRSLQNSVSYTNVNTCTWCRYETFALSENSIRRDSSYNAWLKNLVLQGKEYLIIEPHDTKNVQNIELSWAINHPEYFQQILATGDTRVFKLKAALYNYQTLSKL